MTSLALGLRLEPPAHLEQSEPLLLGPAARRDSSLALQQLSLTSSEEESLQKAKKYAMEQSIKMVLMKQTLAHQQQQAKSMQRHQAVILMCRIYVGSINFEVREDTIRTAFLPFGPIRSISMSWDPVAQKHKGFAFVEFELPEAAQLALDHMNGSIVSGRNIKVGRPSNMPQAQAVIDEITEQGKKYHRVYVASIHPELTENDIKSVFEAFGTIVSCKLAASNYPGKHKGYGFILYETAQAAMDAITSMNLFDLGGQHLRVGRAITPPDTAIVGPLPQGPMPTMPTAAAVAAAAATAKIQAMDAVASNLGLSSGQLVTGASNTSTSSNKFGPPVANVPPPTVVAPVVPFAQPQAPAPVPPASAPQMATPQVAVSAPQVSVGPPQVSVPTSLATSVASSSGGQASFQAAQRLPPGVPNVAAAQFSALTTTGGQSQDAAEAEKLKQEELRKKLSEGQELSTLQQQEDMSIRGQSARHLMMQKLMRNQTESVVVLLKNMVGPEDVDEYLKEEIEEECSKYGKVERVIIYQERQSEAADAEIIVKIFVEFEVSSSARQAKEALHGRFFGGRKVIAEIYDQDLFAHEDFSG